MAKKARLSLYLEDEEFKRQVKVAAAKRGLAVTDYCAEAIEKRLVRDGRGAWLRASLGNANKEKSALLDRMDKLKQVIGPIGLRTSELVEEGRRR